MSFDVTTLIGRRNDERWNRTAVGDILERIDPPSEPDKVALSARSRTRWPIERYAAGHLPAGGRASPIGWPMPCWHEGLRAWRPGGACCVRTRSRRT